MERLNGSPSVVLSALRAGASLSTDIGDRGWGKKPSLLFERRPRLATRHPWRVILGGLAVVTLLIVAAR